MNKITAGIGTLALAVGSVFVVAPAPGRRHPLSYSSPR